MDESRIRKVVDFLIDEFDIEDEEICCNGLYLDFENSDNVKIATAVYPSEYVIDKAIEAGVGLIITHHALWTKRSRHVITGSVYRSIKKLIDNNIGLFSMHGPLDDHKFLSHSMVAAKNAGLSDAKIKNIDGISFVIGKYDGTSEDLKKSLSLIYNNEGSSIINNNNPGNVYILSGSGHRFFSKALNDGCNTYITGTGDEPVWYLANENNANFMSFGHYATELCGLEETGKMLSEKFKIDHICIKENNPY